MSPARRSPLDAPDPGSHPGPLRRVAKRDGRQVPFDEEKIRTAIAAAMGAVVLTLLVGTPALTFIGAVGAGVSVALPRGGLLVSVLVLPLAIPVLIFGVSAVEGAVADPAPFLPPFLILCALTLLSSVIGPIAAAAALRFSSD